MPDTQPFDLEPPDPNAPRVKPPAPTPLTASHNPSYAEPSSPVEPQPMEMAPTPEPAPRQAILVGIPVDQPATASPSSYSVTDLDVCPSCGAPMRGPDTLVCTRCGFNLKTMKLVRTMTGVTEVSAATAAPGFGSAGIDDEEQLPVISRPGRGDQWLPLGIAGLCGLILLIGYLAGVPGLFPGRSDADITFGLRVENLFRFIVMTGMWAGCGMAGLFVVAHLLGMKVGDWPLAAMRMLAIAAVMQLIRLIGFSMVWLEHAVEIILQLGALAGLSLALFHLKPKEIPTLVGSAVALFLLLWLGSAAVVWATTGS